MTTFNVYRRNTVSDAPIAIATGLTLKNFSDASAINGNTYLYSVGAVKDGNEKISGEISKLAGIKWTPVNISNKVKLWLNGDNLIIDASNRISQAMDISGNGGHFTQTTDSYKPLKSIDAMLNRNVLLFDGVDDGMESLTANAISANVNNLWVFSCYKKTNPTALSSNKVSLQFARSNDTLRIGPSISRAGANTPAYTVRPNDSSATLVNLISSVSNASGFNLLYTDWVGTKNIVKLRLNTAEQTIFGGTIGTTTSNTNVSVAKLGYGNAASSRSDFADMSLVFCLAGNVVLTSDELLKLEGWAAHEYGLTDNLSNDHPYKTNPPVQ